MNRPRIVCFALFAFVGCAEVETFALRPARFEDAATTPDATVDAAPSMDATVAPDVPATGDGACTPGEPAEVIRASLFAPRCGSCHGATSPEAGLDLASPGLTARVVGRVAGVCASQRVVVAGDPAASLLVRKLRGTQGACGDPMPLNDAPLSAAEIARVEAWVRSLANPCASDAGAPDATVAPDASVVPDAAPPVDLPPPPVDAPVGPPTCAPGTSPCGSVCAALATSHDHCGACGNRCGAGSSCVAGACQCAAGLLRCGGACVDPNDPRHCGGCGNACAAGQDCSRGECRTGCRGGENTSCAGACTPLATSPLHCGACGRACAAGQTCAGGACACPTGQVVCGAGCVDTTRDLAHCGACGRACAVGGRCVAGACQGGTAGTDAGAPDVTVVPDAPAPAAPRLSADVQPIFTASCARCHGGTRPSAGLSLAAGASHAALVGVAASCGGRTRVVAGAPTASYLLDKLAGTNLCGGARMPLNGPPYLTAAEVDLIRRWIAAGARND